ncbi:hypothetical protein ACOMHN_005512 [Nucella lapillus]
MSRQENGICCLHPSFSRRPVRRIESAVCTRLSLDVPSGEWNLLSAPVFLSTTRQDNGICFLHPSFYRRPVRRRESAVCTRLSLDVPSGEWNLLSAPVFLSMSWGKR